MTLKVKAEQKCFLSASFALGIDGEKQRCRQIFTVAGPVPLGQGSLPGGGGTTAEPRRSGNGGMFIREKWKVTKASEQPVYLRGQPGW